ncbi:MAG: glycosyltransferase family 2 protein [Bradyrhizobium sp.]
MKLSIVTTLYKSAPYIEEFHRRASEAARRVTDDYEIVMVDDGSPDDSLDIACTMARKDPHIRVVELSRNFGHHKALMTGLDYADGELCLLIDSDLEESPETLGQFHEMLQSSDIDVVYGYQKVRKGGWLERITGKIVYDVFDLLLPYKIPLNAMTIRLMRREYVEALCRFREQQTVIGGLWVIAGFKQIGVPLTKQSRKNPTYSAWRRWTVLIDSITSFSEVPLIAIFYLGTVISALSGLIGLVLLVEKFFFRRLLEGWVSVMLSVWLLGGILIFCVGVIGIYISKIFIETKRRPYTIIRRVHGPSAPAVSRTQPHLINADRPREVKS